MNKLQTFQEFLTTQSVHIPIIGFVVNLLLTALLCYILSRMYITYGTSLSNRKMFAHNFLLIGVTTMLVITIVKSSLALSLGLVGALSIVRFRAAIKEPEELSFIFLGIAIGLGMGADQRVITITAFVIIAGLIMLSKISNESMNSQYLHLTISCVNNKNTSLENIVNIMAKYCLNVNLKRLDENEENMEAHFKFEIENFAKLTELKNKLRNLNKDINISFLDNKGII